MFDKAERFIMQYYNEMKLPEEQKKRRLEQIAQEITEQGSYFLSKEELQYGAKLAWRNSNKCIGRLFWKSLYVNDHRHLDNEEAIFQSLLEHIRYATNGGKIRPTISIYAQNRVHIWNDQLIRYAAYEEDGEIIGDPISLELTKRCQQLGWQGRGGHFDVLPLVIQIDERQPQLFTIPSEDVLEVALHHAEYDWFKELHLKWYAVPIISNMGFEIGGMQFNAAPFNGWYMGTEIGARNLADTDRYNMLPIIAEKMGLNTKKASTLWQDRALLELNQAVLDSYKDQGVSIVDHHTAAQQFHLFEEQENVENRTITGNWTWLIPPLAPATTHVFHQRYDNTKKSPNFVYQPNLYRPLIIDTIEI